MTRTAFVASCLNSRCSCTKRQCPDRPTPAPLRPADNEKRLIKKCRELNTEIVSNAAKVQTALRLSEEDQATIGALRKEIEKAWKIVDASHEKEAKAKESITQLKLEIANLTKQVEQGAGSVSDDLTVVELTKQKEALTKERDEYVDQVVNLRRELLFVQQRAGQAEAERTAMDADLQFIRHQVAEKRMEAERESRKKERLERDIRDMKMTIEQRQTELNEKTAAVRTRCGRMLLHCEMLCMRRLAPVAARCTACLLATRSSGSLLHVPASAST